jgi:hypothetical protein
MRLVDLLACGALLVAGSAAAETVPAYAATVQHGYVPVAGTQRLAIVPFACPDTLECNDFIAHVTKKLAKRTKLTMTTASRTSQVMVTAGIEKFDHESGYILAEALAVDAFAVVEIQQAVVETQGTKQISLDGKDIRVDGPQMKNVKISLKLIGKSGAEMLVASGEAHVHSMFSSLDEVAVQAFDTLLDKSIEN